MNETREVGASDLHPPIMHTGPSCAWCKNAGLTDDELAAVEAWIALLNHDCESCQECSTHGGPTPLRCCGCYDGACCKRSAEEGEQR